MRHLRPFLLRAFALLVVAASCSPAVSQSAKELHERGMNNGDSCKAVADLCQAAALDHRYQTDCNGAKTAIADSDKKSLDKANDLFDKKDLPAAKRRVDLVCGYEPALAAKAKNLLSEIEAAQAPVVAQKPRVEDQSGANLAKANIAFDSGDFAGAESAANSVTDDTLRPLAEKILKKIHAYQNAVQTAKQKESNDPKGAMESYRAAQAISPNGPGDPASQIARLETLESQQRTIAAAQTVPAKETPKPVVVERPVVEDPTTKVKRLLDEARRAEPRNLQLALADFQAAKRLDPSNAQADEGLARLEALIKNKPEEQAKTLAAAIRNFYSYRYDSAEDELTLYIASSNPKYPGAAHFYQGATLLYKKVLETPNKKPEDAVRNDAVQHFFKQARANGYQPQPQFLSSVMRCAWDISGGSAGCSK